MSPKSSDLGGIVWEHALQILLSNFGGHALLTCIARTHSTVTSSNTMRLSEIRARSTALKILREEIQERGPSPDALNCILLMFNTEILAKDHQAALSHSMFLAAHVFSAAHLDYPTINSDILRHVYLTSEIQRATQTFTRPVIDLALYDDWLTKLDDEQIYPPFVPSPEKLDHTDTKALEDVYLAELFTEARHYHNLLSMPLAQHIPSMKLSVRLLLLCGRLLLYAQRVIGALTLSRCTAIQAFSCRQRAAAAIAALWWLRSLTRFEPGHRSNRTPTTLELCVTDGMHLAQIMKTLMEESEPAVPLRLFKGKFDVDRKAYKFPASLRLRMWIHYIGSTIEEGIPPANDDKWSQMYHHQRLNYYRTRSGLAQDGAVETDVYGLMLGRFLPYQTQMTMGPTWLSLVPRFCIAPRSSHRDSAYM
ncbi:uncharacterized protein AB675_1610 [Cyphellophora attinorum]|uniref:Transcription factor domain-containing protein n=1 Tax=Cyphellophora attinorum TaxID=1664694 RepID=A0A0N0NIS3_9EURO|nr:uncharacterized protein AB675_1610 [Phialophora attinorum]KPI36078.1 hypothetical protein AB675_1610 [Phialophora attinorum]